MSEPRWDRHGPSIPFVKDVMQQGASRSPELVWEVRPPTFVSSMKIVNWYPTQSSAVFMLLAEDGYTYRLSLGDLAKVMEKSSIINDQIPRHTWQFTKQGSSYLIKLVD